ncbi:uncharacterized protein N7483_000595 [Penicillium malachiteum]|uniref:uncharacterized protein n=1 Tax=Penicillium malachiteum TaxID=1324776 RepID=UPI002547D5A3|nr:uncharacterized protein N7483_000595 [Penicillium malachiteum]KAJ5735470.1 hypothetical protein N7483_000595 [Penicillium malachiteum]
MAEASVNIKIAEGEDRELVQTEIEALIHQSGWELLGGDTIRKTFHFKTYTKVLVSDQKQQTLGVDIILSDTETDWISQDFNNLVGVRCKSRNHHPVTVLKFSSATFEWTTHSPQGLSEKDVIMAKYCEEQAKEIGDVKAQDAPSCQGPKTAKV